MKAPPLQSLFQEVILDHYKRPRNRGDLPDATAVVHMNNPTCGDEVVLRVKLDGDIIADAKFEGTGCSISQASISMMTQLLKGKTTGEAVEAMRRFTEMMHGNAEAARDKNNEAADQREQARRSMAEEARRRNPPKDPPKRPDPPPRP